MTQDEIIKMAKQAGLFTHKEVQPEIKAFAALVAASAIKEALAQPEEGPVAWAVQGCSKMWRGEFAEIDAKAEAKRIGGTCFAYVLYTAPPAAQPEQGEKFCDANCVWTDHHPDCEHAQPATEEKKINYQMLHDFAMEKKIDYTELFVMVQNATGIHPAPFAR
jgi:hypothetical protein